MTTIQASLFQQAAGVSSSNLTLGIASITAMVFILWGCWLTFNQLQRWLLGRVSFFDFTACVIRVVSIMMLLAFIIR